MVFLGKWQTIAKPLATSLPLQVSLLHGWGLVPSLKLTQSPLRFKNSFDWSPKIVSVILALITAAIIFGGIQSISKVSEKVVPFMAGLYIQQLL